MKKTIIMILMLLVISGVMASPLPDLTVIDDPMASPLNTTIWTGNGGTYYQDFCGYRASATNTVWYSTKNLTSLGFDTNEYFNITFGVGGTNPGGKTGRLLQDTDAQDGTPGNRFGFWVDGQMSTDYFVAVPGNETGILGDTNGAIITLIHNSNGYYVYVNGVEKIHGTQEPSPKLDYFVFGDVVQGNAAWACFMDFKATLIDRVCTPSWSCSEYSECIGRPYTHKNCVAVTDANSCGDSFNGDYSVYELPDCSIPSTGGSGSYYAALDGQAKQQVVVPTETPQNPLLQLILKLRALLLGVFGIKE
jgi:hypothetical protein